MAKDVLVNEKGRRIGETHPRAKLTDHEIDLIRDLAEDTVDPDTGAVVLRGLSMEQIAAKFEVTKGYVSKVVNCQLRAQVAARAKRRR